MIRQIACLESRPNSIPAGRCWLGLWALVVLSFCSTEVRAQQDQGKSSEEAMAAYADAANFQTNGAIALAIDAWDDYLDKYPDDPMASMAAHYLGVCHMQEESPDLVAAANAFARALKDPNYDLREESLANHGWCLYSSAGEGQKRDAGRLQQALAVFTKLKQESPESPYLDRALFYSGEASYGLGKASDAIEFYNDFLALKDAKDSPLRCDAFYARGVAQEELKQFDKAVNSYKQLLDVCDDRPGLVTDVHIRMGDLAILQKKYDEAITAFGSAIESTESPDDQAYAMFRQAYALVQNGKPGQASAMYDSLVSQYPKSPYAANATLASAQSSYRSGDLDRAADRFRQVLKQNNAEAATEAAHWIARIEFSRGKPTEAEKVAKQQLDSGATGPYTMALNLDLAEAYSMDPAKVEQSITLFEKAYRQSPRDPLAPRALYNAAFSALQTGKSEQALKLATEFIRAFPSDTLVPDVRFVAAESQLLTGNPSDAADTYKQLLNTTQASNSQRPMWLLRAAAACNSARKFDDTIKLIRDNRQTLKQPAQRAEAQFMLGQALLYSNRASEAVNAFQASRNADSSWARSDEAALMTGQAQLTSGDAAAAQTTWTSLVKQSPTTAAADQARYRLAQRANASGRFADAVSYYDQILQSRKAAGTVPFALYGKGWSLIQIGRHRDALKPLNEVLDQYQQHSVRNDATLARGIALRNLDQLDQAKLDLENYLAIPPQGTNLGHALYELALIDQQQDSPGSAAKRLKRLVNEVPDYPGLEKVLYELGWSLKESGDAEGAIEQFGVLISRYGESPLASEAAYFVGQRQYSESQWQEAAKSFQVAASYTDDATLSEKALYRLGWSHFKSGDFDAASNAFQQQSSKHPDGKLTLDALMMVGECQFKQANYQAALAAFAPARQRIRAAGDNSKTIRDSAERQVRELILLHGGQSAGQLKQWQDAIGWFDELRERFPATVYLPQTFYETGFAYQQKGDDENALKFFGEVAANYRNEVAARARFMMGEIHFGQQAFDKAIPEFQRVMYGFGADKAPDSIKNWQAKSGFEAGRCSELLVQQATNKQRQQKAINIAKGFFEYVIEKHPNHELVDKSRQRLEALTKQ